MEIGTWFDDIPVIGALPSGEAASKLREIGEDELAAVFEEIADRSSLSHTFAGNRNHWWSVPDKPWLNTGHAYGYLAPASSGGGPIPIQSLNTIHADTTLKQARLKITLDRLRVVSYPGRGTHRVLVHFSAQHHVSKTTENLHFNATYRVYEGEHAAISGYPVFIGLSSGSEGIFLKCYTVNVKNDQDEAFLDVLESDVFKSGLQLVTTVQPALVPLSVLALGLARTIAKRHRNIPVQDFELGLDFGNIATRYHLAEGSYLMAQVPEGLEWDWDEWIYDPANGQVVKRDDRSQMIPYNYLVFSISRYEGK